MNRTHKSQENWFGGISSKTNIYTGNLRFSLLGLVIISSVKFLSKWFIVQQHLQVFLRLLSEGANIQIFFLLVSLYSAPLTLHLNNHWIGNVFKVKCFILEAVNEMLSLKLYWWSVYSENSDLGEQSWQQTYSREIKQLQGCLKENRASNQ